MNIVLAGDGSHADFAEIVGRLQPPPRLLAPDVAPCGEPPELLILAQSRPQQFDPAWPQRLLAEWPRTPAVLLLSSWCEGEMRSGKPLTGWVRLFWHQFAAEFQQFQTAREAGRPTDWDRSADKRRVERGLAGDWRGGICLNIGIVARWTSEVLLCEQLLQPLGHLTRRLNASSPEANELRSVDAVLVCADSCDVWLEHVVENARRAARSTLKIVVMNYPRRHEALRLRHIGGRPLRIVSKPFRVSQIQHHLQSFAAHRNPGGSR
jgi:hypothetical protein